MDRRKIKNKFNQMRKRLRIDGIFEACNYHPCRITYKGFSYQDLYGAFVEGVSLLDGRQVSCSVLNCGVQPLTSEQADRRKAAWERGGDKALVIECRDWTEQQYDEFEKEWRT